MMNEVASSRKGGTRNDNLNIYDLLPGGTKRYEFARWANLA
jgi:hypothetical protein